MYTLWHIVKVNILSLVSNIYYKNVCFEYIWVIFLEKLFATKGLYFQVTAVFTLN